MTTTSAAAVDQSEAEAELIDLLNALVGSIWGHFNASAAALNLSAADAKTLHSLEPGQAVPMRVLAARVHSNPSNLTVIVARLEARGLLVRQVSDDRRVKGVRLTSDGEDLRSRLQARLLADHPVVRGLSPAEQLSLLTILRRLTPTYPGA